MFGSQIFIIAFLLSTPPITCPCDAATPLSYRIGPGDIDFGALRIVRATPDQFVMLKRPNGSDGEQVYLGSGAKWRRASRQEEVALSHLVIASGAGHGKTLYRSLDDESVLERSDDMGRSWTRAKLRLPPHTDLPPTTQQQMRVRIVGVSGLTLYADLETRQSKARHGWNAVPGVYVSRDGGDNWQDFSKTLVAGSPVSEANGEVFGIDRTGLVESRDGGRKWSAAEIGQHLPAAFRLQGSENAPINRRFKKLEIYQLEFKEGNTRSAFVVTNGGLFITHDNGKKWCLVTFGSDVLYTTQSVAIGDSNGSHVLATTADVHGPKLWESKDGGESFHPVLEPIDVRHR